MKALLILFTAMFITSGCTDADSWSLYYQPQALSTVHNEQSQLIQPLTRQLLKGHYQTLEQCQLKGKGLQRLAGDKGDFVCGKSCTTSSDSEQIHCQIIHDHQGRPLTLVTTPE